MRQLRTSRTSRRENRTPRGFTLIELLIVIAIIGILISLMLPAVNSVREAARMTQCRNHLKQLALGTLQHLEAHNHFPTGGWGWMWVGDSERGAGIEQPGGWIYNILPYVEEESLHELPGGNTDANIDREDTKLLMKTPVEIFICPSRRRAVAYLFHKQATETPHNAAWDASVDVNVARSDYAANGGGNNGGAGSCDSPGPSSVVAADWVGGCQNMTGIVFQRSTIRDAHVRDGLSNTLLLGEKFLSTEKYTTGTHWGDNGPMVTGHDKDLIRHATSDFLPLRDENGGGFDGHRWPHFGSPHVGGWQAVFCDGSVHTIGYDLDPQVFHNLGNRADGNVLSHEDQF